MLERFRAILAPPPPEPTDAERREAAALRRAEERYAGVWRDRPAPEREIGLRAEAAFDLIAQADPEDLRTTVAAVRRMFRAAGDRVPVTALRSFHDGEGEVEAGATVWVPRMQALNLTARGIVEAAHA